MILHDVMLVCASVHVSETLLQDLLGSLRIAAFLHEHCGSCDWHKSGLAVKLASIPRAAYQQRFNSPAAPHLRNTWQHHSLVAACQRHEFTFCTSAFLMCEQAEASWTGVSCLTVSHTVSRCCCLKVGWPWDEVLSLGMLTVQTDGWLSKTSASIYEASTETLFLGGQDAMQRQGLVPLHRFMQSRTKQGSGTSLLEVACGTGRFATFVKVSQARCTAYNCGIPPHKGHPCAER